MKEKLKQLFGLFGAFAVVGVTTFGGGYAMLPALQREVVEKRRWATEEEVMDWYAIGQCTPGVIAVNTATFVGQKQAGVWGGIFATLGVVFPSLVIIMIIAAFIQNFAHLPGRSYILRSDLKEEVPISSCGIFSALVCLCISPYRFSEELSKRLPCHPTCFPPCTFCIKSVRLYPLIALMIQ